MEGEDEDVETGVGQEDGEEYHGLVESLMELQRSTVVENGDEVPDGWTEVPRRSLRNVQKQTGVGSSTSPVRKKARFKSPTSNRFALLSPIELAGGRRLRLKKKRQLNSAGDSTSAEEEEEEEEDEEEAQLNFPPPPPVRGGRGGKGKGSAGKGIR